MTEENLVEDVKFPELVFGLVGPIGVNMDDVQTKLLEALQQVNYGAEVVHITKLLEKYQKASPTEGQKTAYARKISSANAFCVAAKNGAALAGLAITEIIRIRKKKTDLTKTTSENAGAVGIPGQAYIIRQLKRREEVKLLRRVYGQKFVQVSVTLDKDARIRNLINKLSRDHPAMKNADCEIEARRLVDVDEGEADTDYGQQLGEIFHLGDFFANCSDSVRLSESCQHFIRAFFGDNSKSPNRDEFGAYTAAAAALRSADLTRQVGAAVFSHAGDIISLGCNEVPKSGGGSYWYGDNAVMRDIERGAEQNNVEKQRIIMDALLRLQRIGLIPAATNFESASVKEQLKEALDDSLVSDITEYGRMVHAEMSAVCDAARLGRSLQGATIFVTTFPCHNCAKHIVSAGITRVVFIEPYPKSRAETSHSDSIVIGSKREGMVVFEHFEGISPRRYRDIFQKGKRRDGNKIMPWYEGEPVPQIEQRDHLHIRRELVAATEVLSELSDQADC